MSNGDMSILRELLYRGAAKGQVEPVSVFAAVFHKLERKAQLKLLRLALSQLSGDEILDALEKSLTKLEKSLGISPKGSEDVH